MIDIGQRRFNVRISDPDETGKRSGSIGQHISLNFFNAHEDDVVKQCNQRANLVFTLDDDAQCLGLNGAVSARKVKDDLLENELA